MKEVRFGTLPITEVTRLQTEAVSVPPYELTEARGLLSNVHSWYVSQYGLCMPQRLKDPRRLIDRTFVVDKDIVGFMRENFTFGDELQVANPLAFYDKKQDILVITKKEDMWNKGLNGLEVKEMFKTSALEVGISESEIPSFVGSALLLSVVAHEVAHYFARQTILNPDMEEAGAYYYQRKFMTDKGFRIFALIEPQEEADKYEEFVNFFGFTIHEGFFNS